MNDISLPGEHDHSTKALVATLAWAFILQCKNHLRGHREKTLTKPHHGLTAPCF
jgi:hypothetical protein